MNSASRLVCCTSPPNASVQLNAKRSGAFALLQSVHPLCNRSNFGGELFYLPAEGQRIQFGLTWRIHFFVVSQWDCGRGEGVKYIREIYCVEEEVRKLACSRVLGMELLFRTPFMECGSSHIFIWRRIGRMGGLGLAPKSFVLKGCSGVRCITFPLSITGCLYFLLLKSIWSCLSACSLFSCEGDKPIVRK